MCQMESYHTFKYTLDEEKEGATKLISVYNPNLASLQGLALQLSGS